MGIIDRIKNWFRARVQLSQVKTIKGVKVEKTAEGFQIREVTPGRLITLEAFSHILKGMPEGFELLPLGGMFMKAMEAMIGIKEEGGNNSGPDVEAIQETIGGHSKEAWCMGTVQTAVAFVEVVTGFSSKFPVTEHCLTALEKSVIKLMNPKLGTVCIWQHGSTTNGHTGVVTCVLGPNEFETIEGNTGTGQGINRDGDGVYKRTRSLHSAGDMHIRAFLEPFPA